MERPHETMVERSLPKSYLLVCLVIVAALISGVNISMSAQYPRARYVSLEDTGKTIRLPVGQQLVVKLPLQRRWGDNTWTVKRNSGSPLKLIAGPDERRPPGWTIDQLSSQIFYFRRDAPGTTNLVLEEKYFSKPMVLKVVDP